MARGVRIWSYISPKKTFWRRILNYETFTGMVFWDGLFAGKSDVIMSYSPPLPFGISTWLLSRLWRTPWVMRVEDLYPEAAVAAGILQNQTVIAFFSAMELFLYCRADHVSLVSEGFWGNLLQKTIPAQKPFVTPVWADPDAIKPLPKENSFCEQHGLSEKFFVMYARTLGYTLKLDDVIKYPVPAFPAS
jgi:hypothetical protein